MRTRFLVAALVVLGCGIWFASQATAGEPQQAKAAQAAKDPNYRWHNGQWWYWLPQDKNWMVWNGNAWTKYDASRTTRSYSYQAGTQGTTRMFGTPLYGQPGSVSNRQIIGSYGFHSAGSKALGNY